MYHKLEQHVGTISKFKALPILNKLCLQAEIVATPNLIFMYLFLWKLAATARRRMHA